MKTTFVEIVIPIYRAELKAYEQRSLNQCLEVLSTYPIAFAVPEHLDTGSLEHSYPAIRVERFPDNYFSSVFDYNRLMLSKEFYARFSDTHYILIYQLDAFVFKDELSEWADKNYDYIGAPWVKKSKYRTCHYKLYMHLQRFIHTLKGKPYTLGILGDKVGNGGLSLRKIDSFIKSIEHNEALIKQYEEKCKTDHHYNEDVFWATQNPQFSYPSWKEACAFAIEQRPELCFNYNNENLPFGCHGWNRPEFWKFWKQFIKLTEEEEKSLL